MDEETEKKPQETPEAPENEEANKSDEESEEETSENDKIKSTAMVKYSFPKPAPFMQLQCNTDLNLPPANWFSSSADTYGLQHALTNTKGICSFNMAHMFPDCVGEVDVISSAENIKNLLKIPYHKGGLVSMIVHRVQNTLLLDEFDLYSQVLKRAKDWEALKQFLIDNVGESIYNEYKNVYLKNRKRGALKEKNLVSKFWYHSIPPANDGSGPSSQCEPASASALPQPAPPAEEPESPTSGHKYNRNVVWTFENIEMLLGTDMPIFGGGKHPCVSLRLRDMNKPINVLTGIDYWLDNLMSNVPEVVMCYHLNGFVQKYELIKTEELPCMDDSKFCPATIRDVAQNILSFLKSNATKAGHTYWLFKGKNEEVIKLYDLTSLCSEKEMEKNDNPFTIPVAMLLYRVARNMKHSKERTRTGTIRMLLKNCIKLLPQEKYPEIVTSSLYMLSDLYVPASTNPENPGLDEGDPDEDGDFYEDDDEEIDPQDAVKVLVLKDDENKKFKNFYKPPAPIVGGVEERCQQALQYVATGLNCLKFFPQDDSTIKTTTKNGGEEEIKMAKPSEAIPMPYSKLSEEVGGDSSAKKSKRKDKKKKSMGKGQERLTNALLPKNLNEAKPLPTWQDCDNKLSWKEHLKTLLYEKAVLVYATLSEHHFVAGNYGSSLKYIGMLTRCQLVMSRLQYTSNALMENCLLGRAGDCCLMMVQNWPKCELYNEQFHDVREEDAKMMEQLVKDEQFYGIDIGESDMRCVFLFDIRTIEQMLLKSTECYEAALQLCNTDSLMRRLANSLNEVGSYYLTTAKAEKKIANLVHNCRKAEVYLLRGIELFEKVKDEANVALLYTNVGHLYRLLGHAHQPSERGTITNDEKVNYNKAILNYKKALQVLGTRGSNAGVWDAVRWELSTTLFGLGTIMHENPSSHLSQSEAEKEVMDILQKALQYCDLVEENPKYHLYVYRAASIHYRIASLHHNSLLNGQLNFAAKKNVIQLAKINYEKAAKYYFLCPDVVNYFRAQLQRFALSENLAEVSPAANVKIRHLQDCLQIMKEIANMLELLVTKQVDDEEKDDEEQAAGDYKDCYSLVKLIGARLQITLKQLVKLCLAKPAPIKDCPKWSDFYKRCYRLSLDFNENLPRADCLETLYKVLTNIKAECEP